MIFSIPGEEKNQSGFSKMDMKQISSLLTAVALLCGGCGQESEEVRLFKATKIKAEQGDAEAQFNLGQMYRKGRGVPQNYEEAVKWYEKAALQGNATAQNNLAGKYTRGQGVEQDYIEAYAWHLLAKENGDEDSIDWISLYEEDLTAEQREKGQARAAELQRLIEQKSAE